MARRASRARFIRPSPRTKIWIGAGVGGTTLVASAKALISSLSAGALLLRPFTILRTRMELLIESDQVAASESPAGDYGRIVVTADALGQGVNSMPDPSSIDGDPDASWFVHQPCQVSFIRTGTGLTTPAGAIYTVDSKSMRKVGPNDDVASLFSETSGVGALFQARGRMLIQLH